MKSLTKILLAGLAIASLILPNKAKGQTPLSDYNSSSTTQNITTNYQGSADWPKDRPYWDMSAQDFSKTLSKQSSALEDVVNPFHQPNLIYDKLNCYGGGDYDGFGIGQGDIDAAQAGTNDYRLDVNGDTVVNATDANILQSYKDGNTGYLESHWNFLNRQEKESWLTKMLAIDKTDEKQWISGQFISMDFARLLHTNMFGFVKENPSDNDLPPNLKPLTNGLFNIPLYYVAVSANNFGHGMNAVLTGDNPLNFNDWCFVEPQTDEINIKPGGWNIPFGSELGSARITGYKDYNGIFYPGKGYRLLKFKIDGSGNATVIDQHENLVLTRPTVSIESELNMPKNYSLGQNYPNPFNSTTTIQFTIPFVETHRKASLQLIVYNINGKKIATLMDNINTSGMYEVEWIAADYPSGIYFYQLQYNSGIIATRKMLLLR